MEGSGISDGILTELLREKSVRLGVFICCSPGQIP